MKQPFVEKPSIEDLPVGRGLGKVPEAHLSHHANIHTLQVTIAGSPQNVPHGLDIAPGILAWSIIGGAAGIPTGTAVVTSNATDIVVVTPVPANLPYRMSFLYIE